jgi:biopolymer transport protein ExbB
VNTTASLTSLIILAQTNGDAAPAASVQVQSVWDFVVKGGPMMIPIAICSLAALTVIVERLVSLRGRRVIPPGFLSGLKNILDNDEGDSKQALDYCRRDGSPVAEVLAAGIKRLGEPVELLERHIQEAGEREVLKLRKYLRILVVVAAVAPLMGLLGTIFGMINAFQTVAVSAEALGKTELLAKGIYEAMITTAAGLMVTIPVLIAYHWFSARVERLVGEIDRMTVEFAEEYALTAVPGEQEPTLTLPTARTSTAPAGVAAGASG